MATPEGKLPGPYVDSVPAEGTDKMMVYTKLHDMDIGARPSTLKMVDQMNPRDISHVGGTAGRK